MKRSDMVNIIEYYGLPVEELMGVGLDPHQIADGILKIIEEQGMLPPEAKEFVEVHPHNILGASLKIARNVNRWEPEDEA